MRHLIIAVILMIAATCYAAKQDLPVDGKGIRINACAPTIANDTSLTGNSQTINVTDATCWQAYVAANTKFRTMSTATKRGIQHTLPTGSWRPETVSNYKYVNFSTVGGTGTFRSDKP